MVVKILLAYLRETYPNNIYQLYDPGICAKNGEEEYLITVKHKDYASPNHDTIMNPSSLHPSSLLYFNIAVSTEGIRCPCSLRQFIIPQRTVYWYEDYQAHIAACIQELNNQS